MDQDKKPFESLHCEGRRAQRGCLINFLAWCAALIWIFVVRPSDIGPDIKGAITGIAFILFLLVGPALGILQAIELKSYLDWKSQTGASSWLYRIIIFIGSWLFGLISAGTGILVLINLLFGDHTEMTPKDFFVGLLGVLLSLGFIYMGWKLLQLPFKRMSATTEAQDKAAREKWEHALLHPDFEALESTLGVTLPAAYKAMHFPDSEWYEPGPWMLFPKGLENDEELHMILDRVPATLDAIRQPPGDSPRYVCFAQGEYDEYWILPGSEDPPVYNSGGDDLPRSAEAKPEKVADHLSEFLAWPKEDI